MLMGLRRTWKEGPSWILPNSIAGSLVPDDARLAGVIEQGQRRVNSRSHEDGFDTFQWSGTGHLQFGNFVGVELEHLDVSQQQGTGPAFLVRQLRLLCQQEGQMRIKAE